MPSRVKSETYLLADQLVRPGGMSWQSVFTISIRREM